jgi:hypothetical protein
MGTPRPISSLTTTSVASRTVTEAAIRLFVSGYLAELRFVSEEDGHYYYSIPSERGHGVLYGIDHDPASNKLRCSCPAGRHGKVCKHLRLLQLARGWTANDKSTSEKGPH